MKFIDEKALQSFAEELIRRMDSLKKDWKCPWLETEFRGMPENISGNRYRRTNALLLMLKSQENGWKIPAFMTYNQAIDMGVKVNKGSHGTPVIFFNFNIKNKETGKRIDLKDYHNLSREEKEKYIVCPIMKHYTVFNIDQSNFREVHPEKTAELEAKFQMESNSKKGMYANKEIDTLIEKQAWVCPIHADKASPSAYYSPSTDSIVLPLKEQFKIGKTEKEIYENGMEFYSTALHEMTHSTGVANRLNRPIGAPKTKEYAREELVAELSAAIMGQEYGFSKKILENNVAYLDSWIKGMHEEPKFLLTVLSDVNKATNLICEKVEAAQKLSNTLENDETSNQLKR